jgi:hypothetical protein
MAGGKFSSKAFQETSGIASVFCGGFAGTEQTHVLVF